MYKRQTLYNYLPKEIISNGMTEAIVLKNSNDLNEAYKLFSNYYYVRTFFDVLENGKEAVSYTHLDVYKRQEIIFCTS